MNDLLWPGGNFDSWGVQQNVYNTGKRYNLVTDQNHCVLSRIGSKMS